MGLFVQNIIIKNKKQKEKHKMGQNDETNNNNEVYQNLTESIEPKKSAQSGVNIIVIIIY